MTALLAELQQHLLEDMPLPAALWDRDYLDLSRESQPKGWLYLPAGIDPEEPLDLLDLEVGAL